MNKLFKRLRKALIHSLGGELPEDKILDPPMFIEQLPYDIVRVACETAVPSFATKAQAQEQLYSELAHYLERHQIGRITQLDNDFDSQTSSITHYRLDIDVLDTGRY